MVFRDLEEAKQKRKDFYSVRYSVDKRTNGSNTHLKNRIQAFPLQEKITSMKQILSGGFCFIKGKEYRLPKMNGKILQEENEILKRFSRVFEQTYTRFLDLQKAEAQAKEAEIQLALERVRVKTMAMSTAMS